MSDAPELPEVQDKRLNRMVATIVVLVSTMMALGNIKDGNITQGMQADQAAQVDLWNEYQATRLKLHMAELAPGDHAATIARYTTESAGLKRQALAAKADYDRLGYRDDQFDLSEGFASIALAVTAIAALVESWGLAWAGAGAGALGLVFSIAGFAQLPLHPDWIVGFLT